MGLRAKYKPETDTIKADDIPLSASVVEELKPSAPDAVEVQVEAQPEPKLADEPPPQEPKPAEPVDDPVKAAASSAIKARLAEMDRADQYNKAAAEPHQAQEEPPRQQPTSDEIIDQSELPPLAKDWLRKNRQFMTDANANAALVKAHAVAEYLNEGDLYSPGYFAHLERVLGLRSRSDGNGNAAAARTQAPAPQRYSGPPVSAPPTRDAPSMSTGRPHSGSQITLSAEEKDFALSQRQGNETAKEALDRYARGKVQMIREKNAGLHNG